MSGAAPLPPAQAARWVHVGRLAALAMLLSYVETFVPIPVPGVKLGLANVAVLVALGRGDRPGACAVALIKVLAAGLLFGSPVTVAYSLVGTVLSLAVMAPLSLVPHLRIELVSVCGALAHETGQLLVARAVLQSPAVWYLSPVLFAAGSVTGLVCGVLTARLLAASTEGTTQETDAGTARIPNGPDGRAVTASRGQYKDSGAVDGTGVTASHDGRSVTAHRTSGWKLGAAACLAVCATVALFRCQDLPVMLAAFVLCAAFAASHAGVRALAATCVPLLPVGLLTYALDAWADLPDPATPALVATLRLGCLMCLSRACMQTIGTQDLLPALERLLRPLERIGVDIRGPGLAADEAVRLLPRISDLVRSHLRSEGGRLSLRRLGDLLPRIAEDLWRLS